MSTNENDAPVRLFASDLDEIMANFQAWNQANQEKGDSCMPKETKTGEDGGTVETTAEGGVANVAKGAAAKQAPGEIPKYRIGDKLVLTVWEPVSPKDGRAETPGNYVPQRFVAEVEAVNLEADIPSIKVRWHLPSSYGYETQQGTPSTMVYIANGVWLEARKKPRNITATIEAISEDAYRVLLTEAATN